MRSNKTKRYYVFENDDLFVIAGFVADDNNSFETVLKFDEVKYDEVVCQIKKGLKYCNKRN